MKIRLVESSAETVMLGPLVVFELLFIRLTRLKALRWLRGDIIAVLGRSSGKRIPRRAITKAIALVMRCSRGERL